MGKSLIVKRTYEERGNRVSLKLGAAPRAWLVIGFLSGLFAARAGILAATPRVRGVYKLLTYMND